MERNWSAKTCGCHLRAWDGVKRAYKIEGFIEPLPGTLDKQIHWGLWTTSVMICTMKEHPCCATRLSKQKSDVHLQDLTDIDFSLIPWQITNLLRLSYEELSRCQNTDLTCLIGGMCHGNMSDLRSLLSIWYDEVDPKSTYDSRKVIFFD